MLFSLRLRQPGSMATPPTASPRLLNPSASASIADRPIPEQISRLLGEFVASRPEPLRRYCRVAIGTWCRDTLERATGDELSSALSPLQLIEARRNYWNRYYRSRREQLLARRRELRRARKELTQPPPS